MKKFLLTLSTYAIFATFANAQTTTTPKKYEILACKDVMTDKQYAYGNKSLFCLKSDTEGFTISISYKNKSDVVTYSGISVRSAGIGSCTEHDKLLFLFEDDTKLSLVSWNDFNCKGTSYFDLYGKEFENLNKKIKAIRFENGRSGESYTHFVKSEDVDYFIIAKQVLESGVFGKGNCD